MRIINLNELHLTYYLGTVFAAICTPTHGIEKACNSPKRNSSHLLWLLGGLFIGGIIGLIQAIALHSYAVVLTDVAIVVSIALLATALAKRKQLADAGKVAEAARGDSPHREARYQLSAQTSNGLISLSSPEGIYSRQELLLFALANQIHHSLELDSILETAVQSIRNLLQVDRCKFLWYVPHESELSWHIVSEAKNPDLPSHIGQYKLERANLFIERLINRQVLRVDEVEAVSDPNLCRFLGEMGYKSLLSIPIETEAGEIGAICCGQCTGERPWQDREVELLQAVVAQIAIALDRAQLYARSRQATVDAQVQTQKLELALKQLQATQAKLVQSEKMSGLGQLVAGVAHEINNPINFVHGNIAYASAYIYDILNLLHLYQEHYPHPAPAIAQQAALIDIDFIAKDLPKLLSSMQRGTDRIRAIVQSLRNFSRADQAKMKQVDLHEGIDSTLTILQHRLKGKGSNPEIKVLKKYGNLPLVKCYPGELNQVFLNILNNAIEAFESLEISDRERTCALAPHPSPAIVIRTSVVNSCDSTLNALPQLLGQPADTREGTDEPSAQNVPQSVAIEIADNGPGMPESVITRLFEPFFTTKPVGQGAGLGLSISYQIIVEHHHGVLTCHSTPGQGTEFWIEIPIEQAEERS